MTHFFVVTATDWGQGKTDMALEVATGLQERGFEVGGFCLRRTYTPAAGGFEVAGFEALHFRTQSHILLARRIFTDDDAAKFRAGRREGLRVGHPDFYFVNRKAAATLSALALQDLEDPSVDAFILDEIGPLLFKAKVITRRREKRTAPFYRIALGLVDAPKPVSVLVFSDPDMQSEESLGVRKHMQAHPSRLHDRAKHWRLTPDNFRVLAAEILESVA